MILVTGATGFVGRRLVARLVEVGRAVRALARREADLPEVEFVPGDVRDLSTVVSAARGCETVTHLVGIIREGRGASFHDIHARGTDNVVRACEEAGVPRLLHMSALGARPKARSRYHRSKWEAEEIVRGSSLDSTIFRPSVIFGAGNSFLPQVRALLRRGRVIPIIGDGMSLLQPVWVEDVVSCFVGALDNADTVGQAYELGGAETLSFEQLLDLLAEADGIEKPKVHLPVWIMRPVVAAMSGLLPNFPITSDQLTMLLEDNTCDIAAMRETFGVEPASIRDRLSD